MLKPQLPGLTRPAKPASAARSAAKAFTVVAWAAGQAGCAPWPALHATPPPTTNAAAASETHTAAGRPGTTPRPGAPSDLQAWWQRFGDPQLSQWVLLADQGSPRVAAAAAAWREALAGRDAAAAARWPQLGLQAAAGRDTLGRGASQQVSQHLQLGLEAGWTPDLAGEAGHALAAAEAALQAQQARWAGVRVQVAVDVALAYIGQRALAAQLQLAQRTLASQHQTWQLADWRQQAGLVSALDTGQARTALAQTEALLPQLQTAVAQGQARLAELAGLPPGAGPTAPGSDASRAAPASSTVADVPMARDALTLASPADTLLQRTDLQAADQDVAAAQARVDQARAALQPSLALGAAWGARAAGWVALGDGASLLGSLLASLRWTLFDAGAGQAQVRAQAAALQQAQAQHRALWLGALHEVEDALVGLQGERARSLAVQKAATLAEQTAALAMQRFASGLVDLGTVLDTQRTAYGLQDAAVAARADLARGQVRLFQTLGGGASARPSPALAKAATP